MKNLYRLHKALKWPVVIFSFLWLTSGALHPVLSMIRPRPAMRTAPTETLKQQPKQEDLIALNKIIKNAPLNHLRYLRFNNNDYLQFRLSGTQSCRYLNLKTKTELIDGEKIYAKELAAYYLQDFKSPASYDGIVEAFDKNYSFINRFLPVHKITVNAESKTYVYVHTLSSRLGRINNETYLLLSAYFQNFHNFTFLDDFEILRLIILSIALIMIAFVSISGIIIWWKLRKAKRRGWMLWHRRLGVALFLPLFLLCFSAIFHLIIRSPKIEEKKQSYQQELRLSEIQIQATPEALSDLQFIKTPTGENYQYAKQSTGKSSKTVILDQQSRSIEESQLAQKLAKHYAQTDSIDSIKKITRFSGEYGFINKRLPVWRVQTGKERYYLEIPSMKLALKVTPLSYAEGWSFANLHKGHSLDPILKKIFSGRKTPHLVRNIILITLSLLILILSLSSLWIKRKK